MFRKEYKKDFNSVTPDINLIEKTKQRLNNNTVKKHSGIQKRFVAAAVAICFLIGVGFMTSNLTKPAFALVALEKYQEVIGIFILMKQAKKYMPMM